jgi:hypothetical protein
MDFAQCVDFARRVEVGLNSFFRIGIGFRRIDTQFLRGP